MNISLYHYVHCPFCLRVRMALGHLNLKYTSIVLPYDDEQTPIHLSGKKMLPIIDISGRIQNESLDIIQTLDEDNILMLKELLSAPNELSKINDMTDQIGSVVHPLAMPYWIYTPEFNQASRSYFQLKKEKKRGPFNKLVQNKSQYIAKLSPLFEEILSHLKPFYDSNTFSVKDIIIASHLWGLYIVPEVNLNERLHRYLQKIAHITNFTYHEDFWKVSP